MLQLKNTTPLSAALAVYPDPKGVDTLYAVVKATFLLGPQLALAPQPIAPTVADEYHGDPSSSSLKHASDMLPCKPTTDVIVIGHAHPPGGRPAGQTAVRVTVAERQKTALVLGNRTWKRGGAPSSPEPFEKMPLTYERAYGGSHRAGPQGPLVAEEQNPVGCGFLGRRSADDMVGAPVPNIEDPKQPLSRCGDTPPPVGFGPVAPGWGSRRRYAGTYGAAWQRTRAPYLPSDFDPRFFNVAPPDFIFDRYLQGGEPVQLLGFSPAGPFEFALPKPSVTVRFKMAGTLHTPPAQLDTVAILTDVAAVTMTWRAALPCGRQVLKVEEVSIDATGLSPYERAQGPREHATAS